MYITSRYIDLRTRIRGELNNNYPDEQASSLDKLAHELTMHELRTQATESLPLPPTPTRARTSGNPFVTDNETLKSFLSIQARQTIAKLVKPLAADSLPAPACLKLFWANAEEALSGLHPEIKLSTIDSE